MNMVDKLLKADIANKLANKPTKKVKMERLSKLLGFDFIVTLQAIDPERYADIQKMAVDFTNGSDHHLLPSAVLQCGYGERQILYAFVRYEMEERNEKGTPLM